VIDFRGGTYVSRSDLHMINYKQMRDENAMHMRWPLLRTDSNVFFLFELIHDLRNPLGKISELN